MGRLRLMTVGWLMAVVLAASPWSAVAQSPLTTRPQRPCQPSDGDRPPPPPGAALFDLAPSDHAPLRTGELEELTAFAQERMPRVYRALEMLQRRDPERYQQQLERQVPRLRQMKRVYEFSPQIAELIRQHTENRFQVHRAVRLMERAGDDSALADRTRQHIRELLAANVRIEIEALTAYADVLETQPTERAEKLVAWLLRPDLDLATQPGPVREAVERYRNAATDAEREAVKNEMRQVALERMTAEIQALRQRVEQLRLEQEGEVDRRVQDALEHRPGEWPRRGPGPGAGPGAGQRGRWHERREQSE